MSESDVSLELATIEEIRDELKKRTVAGILIMQFDDQTELDAEITKEFRWGGLWGRLVMAMGLIEFTKQGLHQFMNPLEEQ